MRWQGVSERVGKHMHSRYQPSHSHSSGGLLPQSPSVVERARGRECTCARATFPRASLVVLFLRNGVFPLLV